MNKIAIYTRKSKYTEEGESIENQIHMCVEYAKNMLEITDYEVYEDEGFSGGNIDRPQFKQLIRDIKAKKFTHLICYRLDRISRNVADFTSTLEILNKNNCSFISIKEQFDTSTAMGRAMMNISATFAQLERETIAERIKDNLRELAKTGRWLGGPAPMGYKSIEVENNDSKGKSRKKHILDINEDEIDTIKILFELFLKFKSFQRVSRELEARGLYSRSGTVFSRNLVKQTINNPVYVIADTTLFDYFKSNGVETYEENKINGTNGIMPYNRRTEKGGYAPMSSWIVSIGDHPGIISSDTWIECQSIQKNIKETASNRQYTSGHALLSGLVICGHCGSSMAPRKQSNVAADGTKTLYRYYSCNLKNKSATRCDNNALNAYDAEEYVVNKIKSITKEDIMNLYLNEIEKSNIKIDNDKIIERIKNQLSTNKNAISSLVRKISNLDENNEVELILQKNYEDEILKISQENKELNNKIATLEDENLKISDLNKDLNGTIELFENFKKFYDYTEKFEDKQRLIRSVVKFVVWDSNNKRLDIIPVGSSLKKSDFKNLHLGNSSISSYIS